MSIMTCPQCKSYTLIKLVVRYTDFKIYIVRIMYRMDLVQILNIEISVTLAVEEWKKYTRVKLGVFSAFV